MLNLKKALTEIVAILGVEHIQTRAYSLGSNITVTPRPYLRACIVVPAFFSTNSFRYKTVVRNIAANATTFTVPLLPIDGGTYTNEATVDLDILMFRKL